MPIMSGRESSIYGTRGGRAMTDAEKIREWLDSWDLDETLSTGTAKRIANITRKLLEVCEMVEKTGHNYQITKMHKVLAECVGEIE